MRAPFPVRVALGCLLLLAGCHRKTGPSADFAHASDAFSRIYAQKLDDAFLDPRMNDILTDLHKVPLTSVDSTDAQALEVRINTNRDRMLKEQEQRNQAAQRALQVVDNIAPNRGPIFPSAAEDASVDAGPSDEPTAGMPRSEFEQRFSGCFQMSSPVNVEGRGTRDAFELKDIANCRDRHKGFERLLVLIEGNLVLGVIPKTAVNIENSVVDAGSAQNTAPAEVPAQANQGLPPSYRPPLVDRIPLPDGGWTVPPLPPAVAAPSTTPSADSVPDAG